MSRELLGVWGCVLCFACGSSEGTPSGAGASAGVGGTSGAGAGTSGAGAGSDAGTSATGGAGATGGASATGGAGATGGAAGASGTSGSSGTAGSGAGAANSCPGSTNHTQGERLRGRFVVTAEGDRAWNGWHDTELDQPCSFQRLADGSTRCAPNNWELSRELFSDASCTAAVYTAGHSSACVSMNYVFSYRQGDCTTRAGYEFYELGAEVATAEVYGLTEEGLCTQVTAPEEPLYERGALVAPETFVAAETFVAEIPTRVRATGYIASDGTRQVTSWLDEALGGEVCSMRMADDGVRRCLPLGYVVGGTFADAACSERLAFSATSCGDELGRYAAVPANPYCPADGDAIFERGEAFAGTLYVRSGEDMCEPSSVPEERPLSRMVPVSASVFEATTPRTDESDPGRLQPRYDTSGDGGCWFRNFWDTELGTSCSFDLAEDGAYRCLPGATGSVGRMYTDAACTTPVSVTALSSCQNPVVPEYVLDVAPGDCETHWRVYRTEPVTTAIYRTQSGQCTAVEDTSLLALAIAVDPTTFMSGELRVE